MKKKENNYAFIDSQNLNLSIRAQGWTLDYRKFRRYLEDKYGITKAYLFLGYVPQYQDLYTSLQEDGFILIFKPTLKLPDGKVKGNVDAELVLHAMVEYPKYDKALIVTNDDQAGQALEVNDTEQKGVFFAVQEADAAHCILGQYEGQAGIHQEAQIKKRHYRGTEPFG